MIDKEVVIITKNKLFNLCQDIFYQGKSNQLAYFDSGIFERCLKDELKEVEE